MLDFLVIYHLSTTEVRKSLELDIDIETLLTNCFSDSSVKLWPTSRI